MVSFRWHNVAGRGLSYIPAQGRGWVQAVQETGQVIPKDLNEWSQMYQTDQNCRYLTGDIVTAVVLPFAAAAVI
jgi:hypothetical protein